MMIHAQKVNPRMLAPCGINCTVCYVHLRTKKNCGGCRVESPHKPDRCRVCAIKTCAEQKGRGLCFRCPEFPCVRIKNLDKSYRLRYGVSLIENGRALQKVGIKAFLQADLKHWTCAQCGGVVILHDGLCSECGHKHLIPLRPHPGTKA